MRYPFLFFCFFLFILLFSIYIFQRSRGAPDFFSLSHALKPSRKKENVPTPPQRPPSLPANRKWYKNKISWLFASQRLHEYNHQRWRIIDLLQFPLPYIHTYTNTYTHRQHTRADMQISPLSPSDRRSIRRILPLPLPPSPLSERRARPSRHNRTYQPGA